jgi:hypothetical protein
MQINLEIYLNDMDGDPIANVICNVLPRENDRIRLLVGEAKESGLYRVLGYTEHLLNPRRTDTLQQVCIVVMRERD